MIEQIRTRKNQFPIFCGCIFKMQVLASLCLLILAVAPDHAFARWAKIESAPLHIKRHDETIQVAVDGSWKAVGIIEIKLNTAQGKSLLADFRFPIGDEREELKITLAEVSELSRVRIIPQTTITRRDSDSPTGTTSLFRAPFATAIPFGDLAVGSIVKIEYEIELKRPRIPGVFSRIFDWGRRYPQLSGTLTFETKDTLYLDVSRAARDVMTFSKGRLADGTNIWKVEQKKPIYVKPENEHGGLLTTANVPRLQISNKNTWTPIVDALAPAFTQASQDIFPKELQKIVDEVKPITNLNDRLNRIVELLHQTTSYTREWSPEEGGYTPKKLIHFASLKAQSKKADSKDFAFATVSILRAIGYEADTALIWRESPTDKLWIQETPIAPSLEIFNHAIVRLVDQGRARYFDPTNIVPFGEGYLSDVGGSWALVLRDKKGAAAILERLPNEAPVPSNVKITQTLDLRPDSSVVGTGSLHVEGPLAAELKQLYFAQGAVAVEPYLRSLFGLTLKTDSANPMIRVNTQDRRGKSFEFGFSYLSPNALHARGPHREFDLVPPGIAGIPMLSTPDRATDVILSRNITLEVETKIVGGESSDETNTSCLALTSFASLLRETRIAANSFTINDHIQFKTDSIPAAAMKTAKFQNELQAYSTCLLRTRAVVGPRPAFEKAQLGLSPSEISTLKKPATLVNLQDIATLDEINSSQLNLVISTKNWLAAREMLRRNIRSAPVMLEYANALLQTGRVQTPQGYAYLSEHVSEAAKLFGAAAVQNEKTAKFHRVHAMMLLATDRPREAIVALQNAIAVEPSRSKDALLAGQIYDKMGQESKAEYWLRQATLQSGSKTTRIAAIENLAAFRLKQGKVREFISLYRQAISEMPMNPWLYHEFSKLLLSVRLLDLSIEQSRKALSLSRFAEAESLLAKGLIRKAESIYFVAPGIPTADPSSLETAEKLALECLKYTRSEVLAYRIAGHATFTKAIAGDYGSLIATQNYFAKAHELGANDPWVEERLAAANQALDTGRPIGQIWAAYVATTRSRVPAAKSSGSQPLDAGSMRFPVK